MILTVGNQKGGQAKSTTVQALVAGAKMRGRNVLAVDMDAQGNLTYSMGGDPSAVGTFEVLTGEVQPQNGIQHTDQGDIMGASPRLATIDTVFTGRKRTHALQAALHTLKQRYDHIFIDVPPSLGIPLYNALVASDSILIPVSADIYSLQGLYALMDTVNNIKNAYNENLTVAGVLFTRHETRTRVSRDLTDAIVDECKKLTIPVLQTQIRNGVSIREAQTLRQDIYSYSKNSNPARDYAALLDELNI